MEQQKYSGIEWVGMIPQRWKVAPIGAYFYEVLNKNYDGAVKKALKFTYGNIVEKNNFDADSDEYVSSTIRKYTVVEPGTIMLNGLNLNFDFVTQRIGLVNTKGVITSSYVAFKSINEEYYNSKYANYLFKSYDFCKAFHNMGGGVRKILNFGELRKQYCVIPPINEQKAIVDFLDNKCSEIDSLAADIKKEISILEEYRKSVITESVTNGINPNEEMQYCGLDYIGRYPSAWKLIKLKYAFNERNERSLTGSEMLLSVSQHKGVVPSSEIKMKTMQANSLIGYKKVKKDDLVFNKLNPALARFGTSEYDGITSPEFAVYIIDHQIFYTKFLEYILRTDKYSKEYARVTIGVGDGYTRLYTNQLGNIYVVAPPLREQKKILLKIKEKIGSSSIVMGKN